jgi:phosphoribosylglycinamide formyltransferase-1
MRLAVLISGAGSNLQALLEAAARGALPARITAVISNRSDAPGLQHATRAGVPTAVVAVQPGESREAYDARLDAALAPFAPDALLLAGFMRILSAGFVQRHAGRLLNIHPSLLPRHKGLDTHARALAAGDAEHGASVHFVTPELDGGPVIVQAVAALHAGDTVDSVKSRVHALEHRLYPLAAGWLARGRLQWRDGRAWLDGRELAAPVRYQSLEEIPLT